MMRTRLGSAALAAMCVLAGCSRESDGVPVADNDAPPTPATAASSPPGTTESEPPSFDEPLDFGVVPTARVPLPPNAVTCPPPVQAAAEVAVPGPGPTAPIATVAVPGGFAPPQPADGGVVITGPDGIAATVTVTTTDEDPAQAFQSYSDGLTADSAISAVSVLPGELCEYSGQELMGTLSTNDDAAVESAIQYRDRIVHVWTGDGATYLIAVHVTAPVGAAGFDAAAGVFTGDFGVVIP